MTGIYAKDLPSIIPQRSHRLIIEDPTKDDLLQGDPLKTAFQTTVADLLDGAKVILDHTTSPLNVQPGQTVYVDTAGATGPLIANLPSAAPSSDTPIKFLPLGDYSIANLHVVSATQNVDGDAPDTVIVDQTGAAFEVRFVSPAYGYGFFSLGNTYVSQNVTVNASDLVDIRYVASGDVHLLSTDREHAVATLTNTNGGIIKLPDASTLTEGWQTTIFQLGDGTYTFALNDAAVGEEIIALGDQHVTLGRGTMITVVLTANKKWLIGGGLAGV